LRVLVVGAGSAGLACAESILVHNPSVKVTLMDKRRMVGVPQRCAGGVSGFMAEKVGVSIPNCAVAAKIRGVRIYAPSGDYWELKGNRDYGYVLNRELFEQQLSERVEGLGGKIVLDHYVDDRSLERWQGNYDYIVGADGYPSVVRDWLGLKSIPLEDTHIGVQKTVRCDWPQDVIELYFGEKAAPQGYAWVFPAGEGKARIGLGVPLSERVSTKKLLENVIHSRVYDYHEVDYIAKLIPTCKMPNTGVYGKVLLVGDALPSTDPLTGGGIVQAIASGKAAGKAIAEGKPELYDGYISWLRRQNSRRYRLKKVLYSFTDQDFNDLIRALKGFKPKSLSVGKELRRAVLYLLLRKPSLLDKFFKLIR